VSAMIARWGTERNGGEREGNGEERGRVYSGLGSERGRVELRGRPGGPVGLTRGKVGVPYMWFVFSVSRCWLEDALNAEGIAWISHRHRSQIGAASRGRIAPREAYAVPLRQPLEAEDLEAGRARVGQKCDWGYGATVFEGRGRGSAPRLRESMNCGEDGTGHVFPCGLWIPCGCCFLCCRRNGAFSLL
jgi:hypothetical protein